MWGVATLSKQFLTELKSKRLTTFWFYVAQDMFSEALLCFGASSTSVDEEDAFENSDMVGPLLAYYVN